MTTTTDNGKEDERLLEALGETWTRIDHTFQAEPAPLLDWADLVQEQRRLAKRKLWKELAILWCIGIPILGVLFLLMTGLQPVFWVFEAAATAAVIPLLASEFKGASRTAKGGI